MIHDVANLLKAFADNEAAALKSAGIRHAPTIGKMYEGLTADVLERTLPPGLDLKVVSGFATDDEGHLSGQLDCMLVKGSGTQIPYTSDYKWHVRDVIAVIEVKKNLFSKDLSDAYELLRTVVETHSRWLEKVNDDSPVNIGPALRAFADITGRVAPPRSEIDQLPLDIQHIFHMVVADQFAPIRIAFGYEGFRSETGLRNGFLNFIEEKTLAYGYGPASFPHLIVARNASLVKFTGHPYRTTLQNGKMLLLASSRSNPLLLMLEFIWTRLNYFQSMLELFGDDLQVEGFAPLLWGKVIEHPELPGRFGWEFRAENISKKNLEISPPFVDWEPTELTLEQFVIVNQLCGGTTVRATDLDFIEYVEKAGLPVD